MEINLHPKRKRKREINLHPKRKRKREINRREANHSAAADNRTAAGASSTHASTEGQETDTSAGYDYDVFLSFRGPDSRATFTDFLWTLLEVEGIRAFKDDESLRKGEKFGPKLLKAIDESKILIPIFSKRYASSVWCLKELAQMVKCQEKGRARSDGRVQLIKPIFYDVDPSEVRYQIGGYAEALEVHKQKGRHHEETIREWKNALTTVGEINGWNLHSEGKNRREGASAKKIVQEIFNDLQKANLVVPDNFVDVDEDMRKIKDMIAVEKNETRIIGIHGMGGIGKTTIAKKIYSELSKKFEHCCFLSNIREMSECRGIEYLQRQLVRTVLKDDSVDIENMDVGITTIQGRLCTKKVLLLLDDMDHKEHIDALVGKCNWFGEGSKIIITTRNKEVLKDPEGVEPYEVNCMDNVQSLRLFSKHAFKSNSPPAQYMNQSNLAVDISGGLPLALEIIGSLLRHTEKEMWDATLKMLRSVPRDKVQSKLKISYDALDFRQKRMFLDIACLFIGYNKDILIHYWDESVFFPKEAMKVLQNLSLIKIGENNEVWMHDHLRDLGREMVLEKSDTKIEKQSRVWNPKEGLNLLRRCKGKKKVEALCLELDHPQRYRFSCEDFENLSGLRFLQVDDPMGNFHAEERLLWHESPSNVPPTAENSYLLPQLRWLSWKNIPPTFKVTKFSMEEVVFLNLSDSKITDDWMGWSHMEVMRNLKSLDLSKCCSLRSLPDTLENLKSLIELDISDTSIEELPDSIGKLKNLKVVKIRICGMRKIPHVFWTIEKFEEIEIEVSGPKKLDVRIGDGISRNQSLRILILTGASIHALPARLPESLIELRLEALPPDMFPDLSNLTNLKELDLSFDSIDDGGYGSVEDPIPWSIGNLSKLESLSLSFHCKTAPPKDISLPPRLKLLCLSCPSLRCLPKLPSSLSSLQLHDCSSLRSMKDVSNLKNLSSLSILNAAMTEIRGLGCLENLQDLRLCNLKRVQKLPDLSNLNILRILVVDECDDLVEIQGELPRYLGRLHISACHSLRNLPNLSSLEGEQRVELRNCGELDMEAILRFPRKIPRDLKLVGFNQLHILPDLSKSNELRRLQVFSCCNLGEIQGELPQSLEELEISSCRSLQKLPVLSNLKKLQSVKISRCGELNVEAILGNSDESRRLRGDNPSFLVEVQADVLKSLEKLDISSLNALCKLPNLASLMGLREVCISKCASLVEIEGKLPASLEKLDISVCNALYMLPDLSSLMGLREVCISACAKVVKIQGKLPGSLEKFDISSCESLLKLPDLSNLIWLQKVSISTCSSLVEIPGKLPESLEELKISSCESLLELPDLSSSKKLLRVDIEGCTKLKGEAILGSSHRSQANLWENLQYLRICGLGQLKILPDLSNSNKLRHLQVEKCGDLIEIQGKLPESLKKLGIFFL